MGNYVDENLLAGEKVLYEAEVHWGIYASAIIFGILGLLTLPIGIGAILLLIALVQAIAAFITKASTELAITDKRIIAKFGFIRRQTFEKRIDRLEGINFHQSVVGRILGFGSIVVGGIGGNSVPVPFIANPQAFKQRLNQLIEQNGVKD